MTLFPPKPDQNRKLSSDFILFYFLCFIFKKKKKAILLRYIHMSYLCTTKVNGLLVCKYGVLSVSICKVCMYTFTLG